jgi:hypothetical protein
MIQFLTDSDPRSADSSPHDQMVGRGLGTLIEHFPFGQY